MSFTNTARRYLLVPTILLATTSAHASCGSDFCAIDTHWDAQGLTHTEGLALNLNYSWAKADRLRAGSHRISADAPSANGEELENKRTINQILNADVEYALNPRWNIAVGIPLVIRDHAHTLDATTGSPIEQQAKFSQLGDIRVVGKYKLSSGNPFSGSGLRIGLKLPTGDIHKTMSPNDPADPAAPYLLERSSQPGTGSTDLILGAYRYGGAPGSRWNWFISGEAQAPIDTRDAYRPGKTLNLNLGLSHMLSNNVSALLQLNTQVRGRDTGANANPASGGYAVNLSPGLSVAVAAQTRVYGFLQVAVKQYANTDPSVPGSGQLTAPWSLAMGINHHF